MSESQLSDLSSMTHGYVGADIASVCREAGLLAIRRIEINDTTEISISYDDMVGGFSIVKPSAMREV